MSELDMDNKAGNALATTSIVIRQFGELARHGE